MIHLLRFSLRSTRVKQQFPGPHGQGSYSSGGFLGKQPNLGLQPAGLCLEVSYPKGDNGKERDINTWNEIFFFF